MAKNPSLDMKPLTLEIHGTSAFSRGSELVTVAIAEQVRARFPNVRLVVPPGYGGFAPRSRHGLLTTWEMTTGVRTKNLLRFAPSPLKNIAGIINPDEIDVVLDASGFSLSDDLGPKPAEQLLKKMNKRQRRHQSLILLPQGFGPFTHPAVATAARKVMERASLVIARDDVSFTAASALTERSKLRRFPDVACDIASTFPRDFDFPHHFSAIVPSAEVLDRTKKPDEYLALLTFAANALRRRKLNPVFILHHNSEDHRVMNGLSDLAPDIPVWEQREPKALKGIIGRATLVIGSRYHALVNALMQGVPCIAAGWSHRFTELFKDFDCEDLALGEPTDIGSLDRLINQLADNSVRQDLTQRIRQRASRLAIQSREMWTELEPFLTGENGTHER